MSGTHPSDEALQQFALNSEACTPGEVDHIGHCPQCREAVAAYRMLSATLKDQPVPAFDFDLADSVMAKLGVLPVIAHLEAPREKKRKEGGTLTGFLIALVILVPAWLFRKSAYFVFTDMSAIFYWLLLTAAGIVVGLFLLRLHRKYQDIINLINK